MLAHGLGVFGEGFLNPPNTDRRSEIQKEAEAQVLRLPGSRSLVLSNYPAIIAGGREMIFGFLKRERMGASFPTSIKTTSFLGAFSRM